MKYFYKAIIFREFVPSQNNLRFGKVNPNLSYNWANPLGDITNANRNSPQISINKVGEYTVNISISGTACTTFVPGNFCLGVPMSAGTTNQVPLPNLAVGDIITAGEFEFTITQVTNATQPFAGKATINIINGPGHLKAGLKTEFAGISINECYQVYSVPAQDLTTYFRSEYDPRWGNIFDASTQTPKPAEAGEELAALIAANTKILDEMETFDQATATCGQKDRLLQQIAEIQAIITQINTNDLYTTQQKTDITTPENALITTLNNAVSCITCTPGGRVAGVDCIIFDEADKITLITNIKTQDTNVENISSTLICQIITKAQNTPCTSSKSYNCINGGAVIIAFPYGNYNLNNCRQLLNPGNWIKSQRNSTDFDISQIFAPNKPDLNGNDPISFNTAAVYNIQNNKWNNYKSISDRNSWYVWADKIARKKDNFWFSAADYVTRWNAVGAADLDLNFGIVTDEEEFVMKTINQRLLEQNFTNFGEYLTTTNGKIKDGLGNPILLTGQALDEKMVEIEQQEVQNYIYDAKNKFEVKFGKQIDFCFSAGKYLSQWQCAINGINKVSDGSSFFSSITNLFSSNAFKYAMNQLKGIPSMVPYNFLLMSHRVFMGKKMAEYLRNHP